MKDVANYQFLMDADSLEEEEPQEVVIDNQIILVAKVDGVAYAVDGICSHAYAELVDGDLDGHCLTCPLHFACFDIRTGAAVEGPTDAPLKTYEVKEENGQLWIKL